MKTYLTVATTLIAAAGVLTSLSAQAHGSVQWSVTIGSPGYQDYNPPGVVVWPQSQYIYGAPPAAFAPPPVIYVQPPVQYVVPYRGPHYSFRDYREHQWHDRHDGDDRRGHWRR